MGVGAEDAGGDPSPKGRQNARSRWGLPSARKTRSGAAISSARRKGQRFVGGPRHGQGAKNRRTWPRARGDHLGPRSPAPVAARRPPRVVVDGRGRRVATPARHRRPWGSTRGDPRTSSSTVKVDAWRPPLVIVDRGGRRVATPARHRGLEGSTRGDPLGKAMGSSRLKKASVRRHAGSRLGDFVSKSHPLEPAYGTGHRVSDWESMRITPPTFRLKSSMQLAAQASQFAPVDAHLPV